MWLILAMVSAGLSGFLLHWALTRDKKIKMATQIETLTNEVAVLKAKIANSKTELGGIGSDSATIDNIINEVHAASVEMDEVMAKIRELKAK